MPVSSRVVLGGLVVGLAMSQAAPPSLGSLLQPGTQLLYGSDDARPSPWTIDSVVRDVSIGGKTGCVRLRLRLPPQFAPQMRLHCVDRAMMFNWDSIAQILRAGRPLGAGGTLDIPQANGGRVQFAAAQPVLEWVRVERTTSPDSVAVRVIPTTVTTFDSTGKAIRRLRERFSVALATATGGVFEVADSSIAGGWRSSRKFDLVAIRYP
jgi:hypothetical protein